MFVSLKENFDYFKCFTCGILDASPGQNGNFFFVLLSIARYTEDDSRGNQACPYSCEIGTCRLHSPQFT